MCGTILVVLECVTFKKVNVCTTRKGFCVSVYGGVFGCVEVKQCPNAKQFKTFLSSLNDCCMHAQTNGIKQNKHSFREEL